MVIVVGRKRVVSVIWSGVSSRILDIIIQGYCLMGNGWSLMVVECMILGMFGKTGSMRICCFIRGLRMINIIIFN